MDSTGSMFRKLSNQHVEQNCKPKVGALSCSQRTALKVSYLKTNNKSTPSNDVRSAIRRMRNQGSVPPKKNK
jgi:hypothetical protein